MRLPKNVMIGGMKWELTKDPKSNGGCFQTQPLHIEIGTRDKERMLGNFLHEIFEIVFFESLLRYRNIHTPADNGDYIFVFNHKEFDSVIAQITPIIEELIKINK